MSCNFRELFGFSSLVFDYLTTCNVFILSKMEGTDSYSSKGEKKATEKLSALINTVKKVKWSTRTNLLTISSCLACRTISIHLQEREAQELLAGPEQTIPLSWHLFPLLAHLNDALSTHTLEKPLMFTIIGKKAEISEKKRRAEK